MPARSPGTTRQILANVWPVLRRLTPTYRLPGVAHIDAAFLEREGIDLVIWDVDGTLMSYHASAIAEPFAETFTTLVRNGPAKHIVLSNCDERRFEALGAIIPSAPVFRGYATQREWVTRIRHGDDDTHSSDDVRRLLAKGARQVRKPDARLVPAIMRETGVRDAGRALVVGDQYLTDVATAHLGGARSAKVETLDPDSFPRSIRMTQRLERALYILTNRNRPAPSPTEHV